MLNAHHETDENIDRTAKQILADPAMLNTLIELGLQCAAAGMDPVTGKPLTASFAKNLAAVRAHRDETFPLN